MKRAPLYLVIVGWSIEMLDANGNPLSEKEVADYKECEREVEQFEEGEFPDEFPEEAVDLRISPIGMDPTSKERILLEKGIAGDSDLANAKQLGQKFFAIRCTRCEPGRFYVLETASPEQIQRISAGAICAECAFDSETEARARVRDE